MSLGVRFADGKMPQTPMVADETGMSRTFCWATMRPWIHSLAAACAFALGAGTTRAENDAVTVASFLEKHCFECHGEDVQKGGLRLDTLPRRLDDAGNFERWAEVYGRVSAHEMPPAKCRNQPVAGDRAAFAGELKQALLDSENRRRAIDGRVVLRRINRSEYEHSVHDLFGIDVELKDLLPEDANAGGFDNMSAALSMSSILLERYLEAADVALDAVLVKGPAPETKKWHVTLVPPKLKADDFRVRGGSRFLPDGTVVFFNSGPYQPITLEQFRAPVEGIYRFRISQSVYQGRGEPLTVAWYGGSFTNRSKAAHLIGHFDVPSEQPTIIEFAEKLPAKGTLKPMPYRLGTRDLKDSTGYQGPGVAIQWVEIEGPLVESWPPAGYKLLLGAKDLDQGTIGDAEMALCHLAPRAFRRPVTSADIAPYLALVREGLKANKPFREALRDGLKALLCAPDFLFLREAPGPLDDFALASRLSYFLWGSLPDEALEAAARTGRLSSPGMLHAQVERMLDDAKCQRFVESFTGQWLGLRNINATTPEKRQHPNFDEALQDAMVMETRLFFAELLRHDLSVSNFVHSDFTMLNSRLAELYHVPGVSGWEFRKVSLPAGSHRGGVLCQAAILKVTANGTTTSPVIRGSWMLQNILGKPAKMPPPGVPALEPDVRGASTIRDQVAKHRADPACAVCHDRIDPLGLALENFDVIGEWRSNYRIAQMSSNNKQGEPRFSGYKPGAVVDATGTLPGGEKFANIDELKRLLLANRDQVARCVAEKLLAYATGAGISFADKVALEDVVRQTGAKDHGLRTLLHAVVASEPFRSK